jgi:hypothetical protein
MPLADGNGYGDGDGYGYGDGHGNGNRERNGNHHERSRGRCLYRFFRVRDRFGLRRPGLYDRAGGGAGDFGCRSRCDRRARIVLRIPRAAATLIGDIAATPAA